MKFYLSVFFLFLIIRPVAGQEIEIGAEVGYGKTGNLDNVFSLSENAKVNNYLIGFDFNYIPRNIFSLTSKVLYSIDCSNSKSINYIKVPLGVEFLFGRKIRFTLGTGIMVSALIHYSRSITDTDFVSHHSDILGGVYINMGIKIIFANSWNLFVKFQEEGNLSPLYSYDVKYNIEGKEMIEHDYLRTYGLIINAGVAYKIKLRK
jgi:hypothetical protein